MVPVVGARVLGMRIGLPYIVGQNRPRSPNVMTSVGTRWAFLSFGPSSSFLVLFSVSGLVFDQHFLSKSVGSGETLNNKINFFCVSISVLFLRRFPFSVKTSSTTCG